jgi:hypothetical protein
MTSLFETHKPSRCRMSQTLRKNRSKLDLQLVRGPLDSKRKPGIFDRLRPSVASYLRGICKPLFSCGLQAIFTTLFTIHLAHSEPTHTPNRGSDWQLVVQDPQAIDFPLVRGGKAAHSTRMIRSIPGLPTNTESSWEPPTTSQNAHPKHLRYAWQSNPKATLYNQAGLPAVPFRSDSPCMKIPTE